MIPGTNPGAGRSEVLDETCHQKIRRPGRIQGTTGLLIAPTHFFGLSHFSGLDGPLTRVQISPSSLRMRVHMV